MGNLLGKITRREEATSLDSGESICSKVLVLEVTLEDAVHRESLLKFKKSDFLPSTQRKPMGKNQHQPH